MVDPFLIGLLQTTDRASLRVIFNYFSFGGYTGNEEKHGQCPRVNGMPALVGAGGDRGSAVSGYFLALSLYYNPLIQ